MKRFLLITDALGQGGAERQLACLAIELKKRGEEVRLITFYPTENFYHRQLEEHNINNEVYLNGRNPFIRSFIIRKIVKKWQPDIVIAYKPGTCMAACIAKIFQSFNLIVSERNTTQKISIRDKIQFFLYRFANHIVPNSFSQADFIKKHYNHLYSKVVVITNMVDTALFTPPITPPANIIPQIITTARVTPQKNILTYLDCIAELKHRGIKAHFNWYGRLDTNSEYWTLIKQKIEDNNIHDMVTFHGATKNPTMAYQKSDIFFLPSLYEGFPNVLCEAMACGLPAIATDICDNPLILQNDNYLVNPLSHIDMADKIEKILSLPIESRMHNGAQNRIRILELCSAKAFVDKYNSLA